MKGLAALGKLLVPVALLTMLQLLGCAGGSEGPSEINHAPQVLSIGLSGNTTRVGTGDTVTLTATTTDQDGDELSFEWSGGEWGGSATGSSVSWVVGETYGMRSITCTVSDGQAQHSKTVQIEVGVSLRLENPGDIAGDEVRWAAGGDGPPYYLLRGEVEITPEYDLRIGAGTSIYCASSSQLTVGGGVFTEGTDLEEGAVEFRALENDSQDPTYWKGFFFEQQAASPVEISGTIIRNARKGIEALTPRNLVFDQARFLYCETGIKGGPESLVADHLYFSDCNRGADLSGTELDFVDGSFLNCSEYCLYCVNGCGGSVEGSYFSQSEPCVFVGGDSYVRFTGNSFLNDGGQVLQVGSFTAPADSIDARNNYWGDGATGTSIFGRIESAGDAAPVAFEPFLDHPPAP